LNIEDVRHSHHIPSDQSLAIFRVNQPVDEALLANISDQIGASIAFAASF
jgi:hypothetical protein